MKRLTETVLRAAKSGAPYIVGLAGSVAAGKSTLALRLATDWRAAGRRVEIVSTDGFLYPNATLIERHLLVRKGFPESYDATAFAAFLAAMRDGKPAAVPIYSHQTYDVLEAAPRDVPAADIVIVEGINALQPTFTARKLDVAIYLDATEGDLFRWYYARGMQLREAAKVDPTSYFVRYLALSEAAWDKQLRAFWEEINLPNLRLHILPTRALADFVLRKNSDHAITVVVAHPHKEQA